MTLNLDVSYIFGDGGVSQVLDLHLVSGSYYKVWVLMIFFFPLTLKWSNCSRSEEASQASNGRRCPAPLWPECSSVYLGVLSQKGEGILLHILKEGFIFLLWDHAHVLIVSNLSRWASRIWILRHSAAHYAVVSHQSLTFTECYCTVWDCSGSLEKKLWWSCSKPLPPSYWASWRIPCTSGSWFNEDPSFDFGFKQLRKDVLKIPEGCRFVISSCEFL